MFKLKKKGIKFGLTFFRIGIFLLASAPFISAIFFLFSIIVSSIRKGSDIFSDRWNYAFLLSSLLMIIIVVIHFKTYKELSLSFYVWDGFKEVLNTLSWKPMSSLIGLFNWLPLFLCFWGFQPYLKTSEHRKIASKLFVAGSVPVLISGFGQYWFEWYGPMETLNGLIIWYQRNKAGILTSLFNNQNYAGCWLNIVWPFSLAIFFEKTQNLVRKGSSLIFVISISLASFLTTSRNAWGGLLFTVPLVLGPLSFTWIIPLFSLLAILILLKVFNYFPKNFDVFLDSILPAKFNIFDAFSPSTYTNQSYNRNTIFLFAISKIIENPIIGWGSASFPIFYYLSNDVFIAHAHNLIIDKAFSYGLVVAFITFTNVFLIFINSFKKIYFSKSPMNHSDIYFERAWCTSFFVLLCSQMFDVQYFDGRISVAFWVLLSGLRCMFKEDPNNTIYTK